MSSESRYELVNQVRSQVRRWLKDGEEPTEVSFALSFVATDLGLNLTENNIVVMPVLLEGVSAAIRCANDEDAKEEVDTDATEGAGLEEEIPANVTVH